MTTNGGNNNIIEIKNIIFCGKVEGSIISAHNNENRAVTQITHPIYDSQKLTKTGSSPQSI